MERRRLRLDEDIREAVQNLWSAGDFGDRTKYGYEKLVQADTGGKQVKKMEKWEFQGSCFRSIKRGWG